jgi:tetratricopeptide (TPR) repeat protein
MNSHLQRAEVLYDQARYDLAENELRQALAIDSDNPIAHSLLALCYHFGGWFLKSKREAEEAVRLAPDRAHGHYVLSVVLGAAFTLEESREGLLLDVPRSTLNGSYVQALRAIEEALRLAPDVPAYLARLAYLRVLARKWTEGLALAESGLARDPSDPGCLHMRAWCLAGLRRRPETEDAVNQFITAHPEHPVGPKMLGQLKLSTNQTKAAQEHLLDSLRMNPLSPSAQQALGRARNLEIMRGERPASAAPAPVEPKKSRFHFRWRTAIWIGAALAAAAFAARWILFLRAAWLAGH